MAAPIHRIAGLVAAGTAQRVGVMYFTPQPKSAGRMRPAESLLAACNHAAGRLLGVAPAPRAVGQPPGVDRFAPRLQDAISAREWYDVLQEARASRGVMIVVDPWDGLYRDLTVVMTDEAILFADSGITTPYPEDKDGWTTIAIEVIYTMMVMRVVADQPKDILGFDAVFLPPPSSQSTPRTSR